jgi:hypothetical protein
LRLRLDITRELVDDLRCIGGSNEACGRDDRGYDDNGGR